MDECSGRFAEQQRDCRHNHKLRRGDPLAKSVYDTLRRGPREEAPMKLVPTELCLAGLIPSDLLDRRHQEGTVYVGLYKYGVRV